MDFDQKALALRALGEFTINLRSPSDCIGCDGKPSWYVQQSVEVKGGSILRGTYGNGESPSAALLDHWRALVDELPQGQYLVLSAMGKDRRAVRWNGFMWGDIREPKLTVAS